MSSKPSRLRRLMSEEIFHRRGTVCYSTQVCAQTQVHTLFPPPIAVGMMTAPRPEKDQETIDLDEF